MHVDVCVCVSVRVCTGATVPATISSAPYDALGCVLTVYTFCVCSCVHLQLVYTEDDIEDVVKHLSMEAVAKDMAGMTPRELLDTYTKAQEMRVDRCRDTLHSLNTRFSKLVDTINGNATAVEETHQIVKLLFEDEKKAVNAIKHEQRMEQEKWALERRQLRLMEIRAAKNRELNANSLLVSTAPSLDLGAAQSIGATAAREAISEQKAATISATAKPPQPL